ncbi:phosphatidylserine decarboxylase [Rossellomorea aquimaris]|uniref:phosphatidylserine decarboxylase n=1 Tax=Rossellomorea aquimaris TaxID=189382 RepID=UPI001CD1E0AB|nr:phosphatidylserine decarboxylase [Rossellomorea aquimaris]MCA1056224.1 phosphatidylserine decarboxylase [Rossellomorea aquimaris]
MKRSIYRFCIELTNKKWSSLLLRKFVQSSLSRPFISSFIRTFSINTDELPVSEKEYRTLHDFFIRRLKEDARTVQYGEHDAVSPVDGYLAEAGPITDDLEILVKGKRYSVLEMMGSEEKSTPYIGGDFAVFYLSPANYHRIHSPVDGSVLNRWSLGRDSYPVNDYGLMYGKDVLAKNYREITELQHQRGKVSVVKVGAMFVNSIEYVQEKDVWHQGEEVAYFTFGSTVILLFEKDCFRFSEGKQIPRDVKMGETIGEFY